MANQPPVPEYFDEDRVPHTIKSCTSDFIVKSFFGLLTGWLFAKMFTSPSKANCRKRTWPIIMGTGIGIGMATENCKRELNQLYTPKKESKKKSGPENARPKDTIFC